MDATTETNEFINEIVAKLAANAEAQGETEKGISSELSKLEEGLTPEEREMRAAMMDPTAAQLARAARKPDISRLEDGTAVVDGESLPLFNVGDRIVIERYIHFLNGEPWLDTQTYTVESIDDETGDMRLWNPDLKQHAMHNFILGPQRGDVIKLAPVKGNIGKKKRGRPRKNPITPQSAEAPVKTGEKRGRGRPKGSKNRPKEVIKEEKDRLRKEKAEKKAGAKGAKRR